MPPLSLLAVPLLFAALQPDFTRPLSIRWFTPAYSQYRSVAILPSLPRLCSRSRLSLCAVPAARSDHSSSSEDDDDASAASKALSVARLTRIRVPMGLTPGSVPTPSPVLANSALSSAATPIVEVTANGQVVRYQSTLSTMHRWFKLSSRDVRLLRSSTPVIAVREGYIIFAFGDLKGVLQHNRVTLISTETPAVAALLPALQTRLKDRSDTGTDAEESPFEVLALECMLEQSYSVIEQTLSRLSILVNTALAELTDSPSSTQAERKRETALGRLLPLQIQLKSLQTRARRLNAVLDEVLESDDDLMDMCLTLQQRRTPDNPQLAAQNAASRYGASQLSTLTVAEQERQAVALAEQEAEESEDAQELIENLLDVYCARFEALLDNIEQLASEIETTQGVLELTLDNERNRIARLELKLSMAGICVAACSMVSGFFGMNLLSGVESTAGLFYIVTSGSILLSTGIFLSCWRQFRSVSRQQRGRLREVQALKNVLASLDAILLHMRNKPSLANVRDPKDLQAELNDIISDAQLPEFSQRELAFLAKLLLSNRNLQGTGQLATAPSIL